MEQYKLFVDTSERLVARRQLVNTFFFLSVNTLTLSAIGLIATEVNETPWITSGAIAISIAAIMLCVCLEKRWYAPTPNSTEENLR